MLLREIIDSIESVAPRSAQEAWDNSGMQVGDTGRDIQSVLLTTDVTTDVVDEAIMHGCDLIISHHPLLFHGLKQVCGQTPQARIVHMAIKHDIAIYSAHTSLDSVIGGINTRLADKLGITDYKMLAVSHQPSEVSSQTGLGIIGTLPQPMRYEDFITHVRETLDCTYVRYTRAAKDTVRTIALCGGSGAEFIGEAIAQGADVYLTADCKYHEFQDADGQIGLIDIDHWISERHARDIFRDILAPLGVQCFISESDRTPIQIKN
ncbi:MAG: Nif3-like dinuclear metal center hexameric protein [Paludibacteraceae bacterium]|nr:Nif3-like dinuclear metal center hexameric protein [Paludibacteraceae bacterium]MBQ5379283.1 Nif3-like dinuclear metal center hexameric protein [Paludibacteraceae bacterium]